MLWICWIELYAGADLAISADRRSGEFWGPGIVSMFFKTIYLYKGLDFIMPLKWYEFCHKLSIVQKNTTIMQDQNPF